MRQVSVVPLPDEPLPDEPLPVPVPFPDELPPEPVLPEPVPVPLPDVLPPEPELSTGGQVWRQVAEAILFLMTFPGC